MTRRTNRARRGFSLVELLAVVLILAVLAAVAIPLYINTRRSSAARTCKGNLAAIASAESAWALRNGAYTATMASLVGAPEGLSETPLCPLDGDDYTMAIATGTLTITCPNAATHEAVVPTVFTANDYQKVMAPPPAEAIP